MAKEIKVSKCRECPFVNYDSEVGFDGCNLEATISCAHGEEMPINAVHYMCPLIKDEVTVSLEN